ncbi:MAG: carboxypeptidase M32 [Pararhodobacter sp.]|nr:carboxypeptidase M32 [Pararhodobacter sp.]
MSAFDDLKAHLRQICALEQVMGRLGWDQETMMPRGAAAQRAEEMAALEAVLHARRTDPRLGEWLESAAPPDDAGAAIIRHARRGHRRHSRVPVDLASALARETSRAQGIWAEARTRDEPAHFLPALERVLALKREEAQALADGGNPYDALLADFEPGMTGAEIAALFARLRPPLVALRDAVLGAPLQPAPLKGHFPREGQMRLARRLGERFGYDFARGRLDLAVHPFSSGSGDDVRITTRVDEGDPLNCLFSTIHELGHAVYEQGVDAAHALTPLGQGASMGVHESQARLFENQLGRSRALAGWLFGEMQAEFGDFGCTDADAFHAALNRVHPGHIRTEADELHYNLHIMLRFDLERALVAGDLAPADLEGAWNERFEADFELKVDRPAHGFLQDVHWSIGLFGYFPTYTLGNVYSGCLMQALRADLPSLDAALAEGDVTPALRWLKDRLHRHGALRDGRETIAHACGFAPDEGPLIAYLKERFGALYRL